MGGSGGGTSDDVPGGEIRACDDIDFETTLLSSNRDILETLSKGMVLAVTRGEYSVVVRTEAGEAVGSVVAQATRLLGCMDGGHKYNATVVEVEKGACRVRITYAGK